MRRSGARISRVKAWTKHTKSTQKKVSESVKMRTQKDDVEDDDEFLETEMLTTTTRMMMRRSERMMHCRGAEGSAVEAVLAAAMVYQGSKLNLANG